MFRYALVIIIVVAIAVALAMLLKGADPFGGCARHPGECGKP